MSVSCGDLSRKKTDRTFAVSEKKSEKNEFLKDSQNKTVKALSEFCGTSDTVVVVLEDFSPSLCR